MFMVPFYSWLTTRLRPLKLVAVCNVTLILLIEAFSVIEFTSASLSQTLHIGFAFYIFVGIYGLFSVSQVRGKGGGACVCGSGRVLSSKPRKKWGGSSKKMCVPARFCFGGFERVCGPPLPFASAELPSFLALRGDGRED